MESFKNIKLLKIFNFLTDFDLLAPVAAIYFAQVSGSYALGMSVFSIVLGALSSFISALLLALGGSYVFLILFAVMAGLARSFWSGNNNAFLYDTLKDSQKEDTCNYSSKKVKYSTIKGGKMKYLSSIVSFLDNYLKINEVNDDSWNGLQFEGKSEVNKVIFAVDAGVLTFQKAIEEKADLIVVHHGHYWKNSNPSVVSWSKTRIDLLYKNNICSLQRRWGIP